MTKIMVNVILVVVTFFGVVLCQEACRTPNRREGRCVQRQECRSFNDYFTPDRILNQDELNFVQQSQCSRNPPKICCPDRVRQNPNPTTVGTVTPVTTTTSTTTARPPISTTSSGLLPNPRKFECGLDMLADRIVGGVDTTLEEFPWFALLNYVNRKGVEAFKCGGSLINRRYVLTAAHCLDNEYLDAGERFVNVRLGDHDTAKEIDCDESDVLNPVCADPPQNIGFEEITTHPRYSQTDRNQHNDIALIRLERDAVLSSFVTPVCLPDASFAESRPGRRVSITGFGHTGRKRFSGIKQKALVPIVDQQQCRQKWEKFTIGDGQLCAGAEFNIDSCSGDSGGPLMSQQLYWTVEGIVSFGYQCGLEGWPGVYTRVSSYVDWIKSVIRA